MYSTLLCSLHITQSRGAEMPLSISDPFPALEAVKCTVAYLELHDRRIHDMISQLAVGNIEIKMINELINRLAHAKHDDKKADFSNDQTMRQYIAHIHKSDPSIFHGHIQGFPDYIPEEEEDAPSTTITLNEHLNKSLKNIDLDQISIDVFDDDQIEIILDGLDGKLKDHSSTMSQVLTQVNNAYDERNKMTDSAERIIKESRDFIESLNRKVGR